MEKWSDRSLMRFKKQKCRILHWGRNNSRLKYMLRITKMENRKRPAGPGGHHIEKVSAISHSCKS